jgi:hypothetical protein
MKRMRVALLLVLVVAGCQGQVDPGPGKIRGVASPAASH